MAQCTIAVVVGSLRQDSSRKLARALEKLAPSEFTFKYLEIGDLPLYNQDNDDNPADPVKRIKAEISAANALLFVTPEYNRSMPGVLKNALDNASRPYGKTPGRASRQVSSVRPSAPSERPSHSSTCARCSLISMCRPLVSRKPISACGKGSSTKTAISPAREPGSSCSSGWTATPPG